MTLLLGGIQTTITTMTMKKIMKTLCGIIVK